MPLPLGITSHKQRRHLLKIGTKKMSTQKFATVIFPKLNKNHTICENWRAMALYGIDEQKCLIEKEIVLSYEDFEALTNSFLDNRADYWQQIGGGCSEAKELEGNTWQEIATNPYLKQIWHDTYYLRAVMVTNEETDERIFVNCEGYDYARYVGAQKPDTEFEILETPDETPEKSDPAPDKNEVKVGSIFYHSWGYEQTNIDFYQVVGMSGKTVILQEVKQIKKSTGYLCGTCLPDVGNFCGEAFTKRLNLKHSQPSVKIAAYGWCELHDGSEESWSAYA